MRKKESAILKNHLVSYNPETMKSSVVLIVVAAILVATVCLLPGDGFWVVDNANKLLQVQAVLDHSRYDLPWPGAGVDPEFRFNPLPAPFSQVQDGKLYSIFSPVFATSSSGRPGWPGWQWCRGRNNIFLIDHG